MGKASDMLAGPDGEANDDRSAATILATDRSDNFAVVIGGQRMGQGPRSEMRDLAGRIGGKVVPLTPEVMKLPIHKSAS